jgi:hypothetical protein
VPPGLPLRALSLPFAALPLCPRGNEARSDAAHVVLVRAVAAARIAHTWPPPPPALHIPGLGRAAPPQQQQQQQQQRRRRRRSCA